MGIHIHAANGDIAALTAELANGVSVEARDAQGKTPLMVAVESPQADSRVLRFLLDRGANVNAMSVPQKTLELDDDARAAMKEIGVDTSIYDTPQDCPSVSVLGYAAKTATLEKIISLLEAGADVRYVDANGYSILLNAMHRTCEESAEHHRAIVATLIDAGAPLDVVSRYGESALSVASLHGDFSLVTTLLERGADPEPLGWTPLFFEVAAGNLEAVTDLLKKGARLDQRDRWERTPFLLGVHAGHQHIARFLLDQGSDRSAKGRCGRTALMYAISRDNATMLNWLIEMGWDPEESDDIGSFPLGEAAAENALHCAQALLAAGVSVDRRDEYGSGVVAKTDSADIVRLLVEAGADLSEVGSETRSKLVGTVAANDVHLSADVYRRNRHRIFGKRNPERMNNDFWDLMVRTRMSAYAGASNFDDGGCDRGAVWCFERFGQSITQLPDGRYVEIAGEHEDHYDPDFCIYNDVVVHQGDGSFDILGYPEEVFPPTDFHSATLVVPYIYIIGNLGYPPQRRPGETPVYRLHLETWAIERVPCKGDVPGWIHRHKASLTGDKILTIRGGLIEDGTAEKFVENSNEFELDLHTFTWTRTTSPFPEGGHP